MARGGRWGGGEEGVRSLLGGYIPLQMMDACLTLSDLHFCSGFDACTRL